MELLGETYGFSAPTATKVRKIGDECGLEVWGDGGKAYHKAIVTDGLHTSQAL